MKQENSLTFIGCFNFRNRIVYSCLSRKPIKINNIRINSTQQGLLDYELNFLDLIKKITIGTKIELLKSNKTVKFTPGSIINGNNIEHNCNNKRSIGYYLESLLCIAIFGKTSLSIVLKGITHNHIDTSIESLKYTLTNYLSLFGIGDININIIKRGFTPLGNGIVSVTCPIIQKLSPIFLTKVGKIKSIKGISFSSSVPRSINNRMINSAKGILNEFCNKIWLVNDYIEKENNISPGYGLFVYAISTKNCILSCDNIDSDKLSPEDIGMSVSKGLLQEINNSGCVNKAFQHIMLLLMAINTQDVSKIKMSKLTRFSINCLRELKQFFGVIFKIEQDNESECLILSCVGCELSNMFRGIQ